MTTQQEHHLDQTRNTLVAAAIDLFCSQGVERTTVDDLAPATGLSVEIVRDCFPSQALLLTAVTTWALDDFDAHVLAGDDPSLAAIERLEGLVRRHAGYQIEHAAMIRAGDLSANLDAARRLLTDEVLARIDAVKQHHLDLLTELIDEVADRAANPPARLSALATLTMVDRLLTWYRREGEPDPGSIGTYYWSLVTQMLRLDG